jgi:hypothetical protein
VSKFQIAIYGERVAVTFVLFSALSEIIGEKSVNKDNFSPPMASL